MGLQEGIGGFICKPFSEKGILQILDKLQKETQPGSFRIVQEPKPFLFVPEKELLPFVKLVHGNTEALTEAIQGREPEKSFRQDTEDEEEAVAGIRDDHIWKDGMGVAAAFTDQPEDSDFQHYPFPMDKVDDVASVVSMNAAVGGRTADRAGFLFRAEGTHVGIKQNF